MLAGLIDTYEHQRWPMNAPRRLPLWVFFMGSWAVFTAGYVLGWHHFP